MVRHDRGFFVMMIRFQRTFTLALTMVLAGVMDSQAQPASPEVSTETVRMVDGIKIERLAEKLGFPEGPVWLPSGKLLFSDVHNGIIYEMDKNGKAERWHTFAPPGSSNGLILDLSGKKLFACGHGERAFLEFDLADKSVRYLAKDAGGRPFCNVNDVAVNRNGFVYFTDPKWGEKPGDVQGVYRVDPSTASTTLVAEIKKQPNGIVVSPDQKSLFVVRTGGNDVWHFDVQTDGMLSSGTQWMMLPKGTGPDGMTIDSSGTLYIAGAGDGTITVVSREKQVLRKIPVFRRVCTNCEFEKPGAGGIGNGRILYATGDGQKGKNVGAVYRLTFP
jgi:sugar lactone lactonase YvrE